MARQGRQEKGELGRDGIGQGHSKDGQGLREWTPTSEAQFIG